MSWSSQLRFSSVSGVGRGVSMAFKGMEYTVGVTYEHAYSRERRFPVGWWHM